MNAVLSLWQTWQERVKEILPKVHGHQVKTLAWYVLGIVVGKSVVPNQIAVVYRRLNGVKESSHMRRLERFLTNPQIHQATHWYPFLPIFLARWKGKSVKLILDASPLMGEQQVYMLGIVFDHRILPVIWRVMPLHETWTISQWKMIREMVAVLSPYLQESSCMLLADRGLGCWELAQICHEVGWHYVLRVSCCCQYETPEGIWQELAESGLKPGERKSYTTQIWKSHPFLTHLTLAWDARFHEPWYLISDQVQGTAAVREYAKRMRIEATFEDWKKRGWHLTASLVHDPNRLDRLLIVLAIAWWWVQRLASACIHHGNRSLFDRADRRDKSYLKIGMAWLQVILLNACSPASVARAVPFFHRNGRLIFTLRP